MKSTLQRSAYLAAFAILAVYVFLALHGPQGIPALLEKRRAIRELQEKNASLIADIEARKQRLKRLEEVPSEQEKAIRERLKLVRPGETVYVVPDAPEGAQKQFAQP
jgi:cell division protein FtsB